VIEQIVITHEGTYIKVLSNGEKSFQFAEKLWTEVRDTCRKHQCYEVLGVAETSVPMETFDALEIAGLFE